MSKRLATVVLAFAALCSLAITGVRITRSNDRYLSDSEKHIRVYGTTPALAAATLASLRKPPGFRDAECFVTENQEQRCWSRTPSVPLEGGGLQRLLETIGVRPYSVYNATYHDGAPSIQCSRFKIERRYRLGMQKCQVEALKGDERLAISAQSFVLPSHKATRRSIAPWKYPTEVRIAVIGHFEHEGIRAGEQEG
ncbi:MAG TPA: hypothetical protein VH061_07480 [Solirubrobacteraceae bacterium]|nr:hypothetical protein [Solirubrobacteraceae bacterium]